MSEHVNLKHREMISRRTCTTDTRRRLVDLTNTNQCINILAFLPYFPLGIFHLRLSKSMRGAGLLLCRKREIIWHSHPLLILPQPSITLTLVPLYAYPHHTQQKHNSNNGIAMHHKNTTSKLMHYCYATMLLNTDVNSNGFPPTTFFPDDFSTVLGHFVNSSNVPNN